MLFHAALHSLVDGCVRPDRGRNLRPRCIGALGASGPRRTQVSQPARPVLASDNQAADLCQSPQVRRGPSASPRAAGGSGGSGRVG